MAVVRTRFAPSPTGFLHVGGVRTALFNYLFAKQNDGTFILRLEDTDRERFVAEGVGQIVESLDWLGLKPDEGFWISEGVHQGGEYVQSQRQTTGLYQRYAQQLVADGLAYYSPTSPKQLDHLREKAKLAKKPFIYRKADDKTNTSQRMAGAPIRIDIETCLKKYGGEKLVAFAPEPTGRSPAIIKVKNIEDFVLVKADGFPTYNFANVIDDHEMNISHVMRGEEFIASTPKHVLLYHVLGFKMPSFIHLPVINGADGKKLSKRTGDTNVLDYRDRGYLPQALLNFLALLGWNDGTEQEIFSLDELVKKFRPERVNTSPAIFDLKRLDWLNGHYIRQLPINELYKKAENFLPAEAAKAEPAYKKQVLGLVQERLKYFAELPELTTFFFEDLPVNKNLIKNHKKLGTMEIEDLKTLLETTRRSLGESNFTAEDLTNRLNALLVITHTRPNVLFSLIRIATTQAPASPDLADTLAVLGKERSLRRLDQQLAVF